MKGKAQNCPMPPEFIISIKIRNEEYMIGVTCDGHKKTLFDKLTHLQKNGKVPKGMIRLSPLKAVGTNCIRMDPDDLIRF